jgi:hypothetical protein
MENTKDNCEKIRKIWKKSKLNSEKTWKHGKKSSWIVIRFGKYGRKASSWIVKRYGKYRRKLWNDMENMEEKTEMIWKIM